MIRNYSKPETTRLAECRWPDRPISASPAWCAVDLRDGNQALPNPMTPEQKTRYFDLLVAIGFKEIEIGFPSASADDFNFCRSLIEGGKIPDDVTISVLTQCREHLIRRTFEALRGVKKAVCHTYIATSDLHMHYVFGKTADQTQAIAVDSVRLIRDLAAQMNGSAIGLEFSPEEFTDTDLDFAVGICDAVVEAWNPGQGEKVILNLPATVERRPPNEYADMIELFMDRQKHGDRSTISLHAHNDMGCAVASTQMAIQAGAQRVEGTLFGHGERSGNVDLVTLALNLQYMGIDTGLDFSDIEAIRDEIIDLTSMPVSPRHPYAGELVFTAFSGSHQDAIHKGLNRPDELKKYFGGWKIPYLHIDPADIGRTYEKFIRINSQSGKGGVAHVLQLEAGVQVPRGLLIDFAVHVQKLADTTSRELNAKEVWQLFKDTYHQPAGVYSIKGYWPRPCAAAPSRIEGEVQLTVNGVEHTVSATADGPIAAFVHAIKQVGDVPDFALEEYEEDAIGNSADAEAIAFIRISGKDGKTAYGVGFNKNIDQAAVEAVISALNRMKS
ncbi:MAG: 2-isopropylmalate synthase [Lentisphaeria bacterium]|nr:2-isopropylmalate synthase [Lentisphaeria bacterium]